MDNLNLKQISDQASQLINQSTDQNKAIPEYKVKYQNGACIPVSVYSLPCRLWKIKQQSVLHRKTMNIAVYF